MIRLGRVLLVDGSAVFREVFAAVLEPHAEEVAVAADCESAIALLDRAALPDLLLCEAVLPDGEGFEVIEHLHAPFGTAPISILLTSEWSRRTAEQARVTGAAALLAKPLGFRDLATIWKQQHSKDWKETQRAHARPLGVAFVLDPAAGDLPLLCCPVIDLDAQGALIDAGGPIPVGTILRLDLHLDGERCGVGAQVIRVQDPGWERAAGVALRFLEPSEALRGLIAQALA